MTITKIIPLIIVIAAVIALAVWFKTEPSEVLEKRLPGRDKTTVTANDQVPLSEMRGTLAKSDGVPADLPGAWPRFRGENFDNIFHDEQVPLQKNWPESGPKVLWSLEVGEGYAGAAVRNGCVYILDYDREKQADALRCLSLADGKEIWRYSYPVKVKRNHGMSRTVPAVTDKYVVSLGPKCHVTCLDAESGAFRWMIDLVRQFGTKVPLWYAGQCPLIDNERAIIAPGGKVLMTAVDCATGKIIWETENPHHGQMTHSSIMPLEFAGRRMFVYCASSFVVGVSAQDGQILWESTDWKIRSATVPSPLIIGEGKIFFCGGYNAGSMMMRLTEEKGRIIPQTLFRLGPEIFDSIQQTPILYGGYIYGVRSDEQLVCHDLEGKIVWTGGSDNKFGLGPYLIANGLIYIMNDSGLLTLAGATPNGYQPLAQARVLTGPDSWGPMAMAWGRLILRDLTKMICLDVTEK